MRILDSEILAEAQKTSAWPIQFVEIRAGTRDTDSDVVRLSTFYTDLTDSEGTFWRGAGYLLQFAPVMEQGEAKTNEVSLSLDGLDNNVIALVAGRQDFVGSQVNIYRGYFNSSTGNLVGRDRDKELWWRGVANNFSTSISHGLGLEGTKRVTLTCKSILQSILETKNGRFTSQASFQQFNPTDRSMEYIPNLRTFSPRFGQD